VNESDLADRLGVPVTVFASTPDTSAHLRRQVPDAPHGTFAVAEELTAARGRSGDAWAAPPGGVWSSTLLYPGFGPEHVGRLTVASGLATCEACRSFGVDARLKWPNDVVVDGAASARSDRVRSKLAGVLVEAVVDAVPVVGKPVDEALDEPGDLEAAVVGVGINADLDPVDLNVDRPVTTLRAEVGSVDREEAAARLHERLLARSEEVETAEGFATVLDEWREHAATLGERVVVETGDGRFVGTATDVTPTGALVVETDAGEERVVTPADCERLRRR
jgi:BirA family biotin operon repressor/biotin-[acetyl-CoA-carboxylase] ligase